MVDQGQRISRSIAVGARMKHLNPHDSRDVLSDALRHVHVRGAVYCRSELRAPWAFSVEERTQARFHAVLAGRGLLEVEGEEGAVTVSAGDLILLPHGHAHVLRDCGKTPPIPLDELIAQHPLEDGIRLRTSGRGAPTVILCGGFELEGQSHPLRTNLPGVLHVRGRSGRPVRWVQSTLRQIDAETRSARAGSQTVIARLSEVLFLQAVRAYFGEAVRDGRGPGW